ncbi:MAG TPA: hypothetical protein PKY77_23650 [Phycisphaerae bacterium]|nr:hypothetical protein [Phycisphaerae bacterium]HRY69736.1 hypothetical protein [Phycisphaerae bacterium]HSA29376.1 hypothetical protein [Phycisphaerae bacterium]
MIQQRPPVIWITFISLALMVLGKILAAEKVGPLILIDAGISAVLLCGLWQMRSWTFILTLAAAGFGTGLAFTRPHEHGVTVLLLNALVVVPLLLCRGLYLRPDSAPEASRSQEPSL